MENQFWLERWEQDQIGFHQQEINRYLSDHWAELGLSPGAPVFVPLCGKSLDMLWLRSQGHAVTGIELSRKAVEAFFTENGISAEVAVEESFISYRAEGLRLLVGDFFALQADDLAGIGAVYDRASLIALPPSMRDLYAMHMAKLLPRGAHVLLITMEYPEGVLQGPPFSVAEAEVEALYGKDFTLSCKGTWQGVGPRGIAVDEKVYLLTRR